MSETTTITFEGLKGVGNVELNLRADQRVYAFIGTNGVGKTKVLEGVFQTNFIRNNDAANYLKNLFMPFSSECFVFQELEEKNCSKENEGVVLKFKAVGSPQLTEGTNNTPVIFIGSQARSYIELAGNKNHQIGTFKERKKSHLEAQVFAIRSRDLSSLGMSHNISEWFVSRAQSGNPYQKEADNRSVEIQALLETLAKVDSRFDPSFMEIAGANDVSLKVAGVVTELSHLSSGFASMVKMLQAIIAGYANFTNETNITHVKGIVLIDEIESHLHIEWQSKIIPLLKEIFPNTTFYVATHSALVLTQLQQGEAYLLKRDETDGVVRSEMIKNPGGKLFHDVLDEAFGVNLNGLKRKHMDEQAQAEGKKLLLELLDEVGQD